MSFALFSTSNLLPSSLHSPPYLHSISHYLDKILKSDKKVSCRLITRPITPFTKRPVFVYECIAPFLNHHDLGALINTSHEGRRIFNSNTMWEYPARRFYPKKEIYNQGLTILGTPKALIEFQFACLLIEVVKRVLFQAHFNPPEYKQVSEWLKENRALTIKILKAVSDNNYKFRINCHFSTQKKYGLTRNIVEIESWDPDCIPLSNELRKLFAIYPLSVSRIDLTKGYLPQPLPMEMTYLVSKDCHTLNLSRNYFDSFPKVICSFTKLNRLDLSICMINEIPDEIENLKFLQYLNLSKNQLYKINPKIGKLTELLSLRLDSNCFSELPEEIGNLKRLQILHIQNNYELKRLPNSIVKIGCFEELVIDTKIPIPKGLSVRSKIIYG